MEFRILGPLEIVGDGVTIDLGGPKQRAVLAHLLIGANQVVSADRLIAEIWGEEASESALASLHSYVSRLRRLLGDAGRIEWRSTGYRLLVDPEAVDAQRFEIALRDARRLVPVDPEAASARLGEALELWRGAPLSDVPGPAAGAEAARLEELRLAALEERAATNLALGREEGLVAELEAALRENPLRERLWAHLMLALYRTGRQADALDAYQRVRRLLDEELGLEPSPELAELQLQILQHAPALEQRGLPLRGYQLLERIGEGTFGIVHRALQPHVGREVALKAIHPRLAHHPEFIRRFEVEAQLVARLEHPRIVPLYDYWRDASGAFLVMRWLRGGSLRQRLGRQGRFDLELAARLADQIAAALSAAHRQGIVHRDLKPANILLDEDGDAYLSDFGIAREVASATRPSADGSASTAYSSPEELRGEPVTPRTDIYALGAILHELLLGEAPQKGGSPASPPRHRPAIPAAILGVIAKAMAPDPADRFPDAVAFAAALHGGLERRDSPRAAASPAAMTGAVNPFKGLRPFQEADAGDFFGREALIGRLTHRLAEDHPASRFLAVVGPSGSGKSSVVRAGLLPALRRGAVPGSDRWFVAEMFPGPDPMQALGEALLRVAPDPPGGLEAMLALTPHGLLAAGDAALPAEDSELLLVVDQFEELFTLVTDEALRARFVKIVATAMTERDSRIRIVATLRADFYDRPLEYPALAALLRDRTELVEPLSATELESAIVRPAERSGFRVEPALTAELIADVLDQPGSLPLLQYALTQLFERARDGELTLSSLHAIGGLSGAIAGRADELYKELPAAARDVANQVFLRLVTITESGEETRRRVLQSELAGLETDPGMAEWVVDAFGRARLLSFDRDRTSRAPTVEVAHEALLRAWSRLRGWIEAARDDLFIHRRLAGAASAWEAAGRDDSYLARGGNLEQLERWAMGSGLALTTGERDFLTAGVAERTAQGAAEEARRAHEAALERRAMRRLRGLLAVLSVGVLTAAGLAAYAFAEGSRAEQAARSAAARELAAASGASLAIDPDLSILLALEAIGATRDTDGITLREAEEALHAAVQAMRVVERLPVVDGQVVSSDWAYIGVPGVGGFSVRDAVTGEERLLLPPTEVARLAVSPDGHVVAAGPIDGPPSVWDGRTGQLLLAPSGKGGFLDALVFSPDGARLAAMTVDEQVKVWDLGSGGELMSVPSGGGIGLAWSSDARELVVAAGSETQIYVPPATEPRLVLPGDGRSVAISRDAGLLLTTGEDTANLWDARSGEHLHVLGGHTGIVNAAIFSADGRLAATGGHDGTARVWDTETGASLLVLLGHAGSVDRLRFSPDATRLYSLGATDRVAWDITSGGSREVLTFGDHSGRMPNVTYSPDGSRIASAGFDGRAAIWEARTGRLLFELVGHEAAVADIVFSRDGNLIATAGFDGTARLWDQSGSHLRTFDGHAAPVWAVSFDPEADRLVTASEDFTARVWEVATGRQLRVFEGHGDIVWDAAWSPDGSVVVSVGNDFAGRAWDPDSGEELATLSHDENVVEEAFSADSQSVGTASFDTTAKIWDASSGELQFTLSGHGGVVLDVEASPDGRRWATASLDRFVRLWDAATGDELLKLAGPASASRLAFSPDGRHLATAGDDGRIRIYALEIDEVIGLARERLSRALTDTECRQYLHIEACPAAD